MFSLPQAFSRHLITVIAVLMSVFHLYVAFVGPPDAYVMRGWHLAFALVLAFLVMPGRHGTAERVGWVDLLLVLAAVAAALYPSASLDYIQNRFYYVDDPRLADYVFGGALIVLVMEATRRATGWALPITAMVFLVYGLTLGNQSVGIMLDQLYLTTEGIFGIPLYVSATYVMLFILFGAFVERSGAGQLFMDFALALAGHTSGGPAKVAVITSSLFGTVSGSAVANVMTTGTFTIPLMMRTGYRPAFSGAVEAVASTGGQLMPPIMGAAAFVMAEFLGVSYLTVAAFALLPALLYYVAVFMAVHFEAKRTGLVGVPKADLPRLRQVMSERGHLFLPLIVIIAGLLTGRSAAFSALCGIVSVIPTTWLRASTRATFTVRAVIEALEAGARNTLVVALACACRPRPSLHRDRARSVAGFADPGAAADHAGWHFAGHGPAHHACLHRAGGAVGTGAGQARYPGRGGSPVCAVFRGLVGNHTAGGDGGVCGQWHLPRQADGKQLGGHEAGPDRLHHPLHVCVFTGAAADGRLCHRQHGRHHGHHRGDLSGRWVALVFFLWPGPLVGAADADRRRSGADQAGLDERLDRSWLDRTDCRQPALVPPGSVTFKQRICVSL